MKILDFSYLFITMYFIVMLLIGKKGNADHVLNQPTTKP
jgi:hypothetical protein